MKIGSQKLRSWLNISPLMAGILICIASFLFGFADLFGLNQYGSKKSLDLLSQSFPYDQSYPENAPGLVLIAIDDASIERLGQWPWPRQTLAKIVENLRRSKVGVIGVDVLFLEEDRYSPQKMSKDLRLPLPQLESLGIKNGDVLLGNALSKSPAALAFALGGPTPNPSKTNRENSSRDFQVVLLWPMIQLKIC